MAKDKIKVVMGEFKRGTLKSGSGEKVTDRKQAQAIALSERRKQGGKMPSYYDSKSSKPKKGKVKKYGGGGRFGESVNPLIDKKYGHCGLIRHNPSDINP